LKILLDLSSFSHLALSSERTSQKISERKKEREEKKLKKVLTRERSRANEKNPIVKESERRERPRREKLTLCKR